MGTSCAVPSTSIDPLNLTYSHHLLAISVPTLTVSIISCILLLPTPHPPYLPYPFTIPCYLQPYDQHLQSMPISRPVPHQLYCSLLHSPVSTTYARPHHFLCIRTTSPSPFICLMCPLALHDHHHPSVSQQLSPISSCHLSSIPYNLTQHTLSLPPSETQYHIKINILQILSYDHHRVHKSKEETFQRS